MMCDRCNYFSFCTIFCPFTLLTAQKNQNFKKMKKTHGDIIISHKCTKNHDHMLYYSWDMACDRCNCYFSFWAIVFPFYPPNNPKNENFTKMKKAPGNIILLHKRTKNHDHMLYCYWHKAHDRCNYYFPFWTNFCSFTPLTAQKIKIS